MRIGNIPIDYPVYRNEKKPTDEPPRNIGQIEVTDIENGLKAQKVASFSYNRVHELDGTIRITQELTEDAYRLIKEAGYTKDDLVFNLGKKPEKYLKPEELPAFKYNWESGQSLIDSFFDSAYRNITEPEHNYTKVIFTLKPPTQKPQVAAPEAPVASKVVDEGRMKVGDIIDPTRKNYGPVEEPAYDVALTSKANYNYRGQAAYVEGAYTSRIPSPMMITQRNYKHDFLKLSNGVITEYANKIATGQMEGLDALDNELWLYAERALEYFGGYNNEYMDGELLETGESIRVRVFVHHSEKQIQGVYNQFKDAVSKYAERIKNGDANIDSVNSNIIIADIEFTLGEVIKTQDYISNVIKNTGQMGGGADYYASMGLAIAAVNNFAKNNLSADTSNKVSAMFEKRITDTIAYDNDPNNLARMAVRDAVDEHARKRGGLSVTWRQGRENRLNSPVEYFDTLNGDLTAKTYNAEAFMKFKNMGKSETFDAAFKDSMSWMEKQYNAWFDDMGHVEKIKLNGVTMMSTKLWNMYNAIT